MMNQFRIQYRPGGMGINHSSWWITETKLLDGIVIQIPMKFLKRADYK